MATNNETVEEVCDKNLRNILDTFGRRVRVFDEIADDIVAAHKRELAARDAEISDLKDKNTEAFKAVLKRDALVKKLADALEREERREKKYEYTVRTASGHSIGLIPTSEEQARRHMINGDILVRREVGEWEEVK